MHLWLNCIIGIFIIGFAASDHEALPFWQRNSKLYKQITEKRRVVVSVKPQNGHRVLGAGLIAANAEFVTLQMGRFESLPQVSSYFKEAKHNSKEKKLFLFIKAFGYQTRFILKYQWQKNTSGHDRMEWKVIWGPLKGAVGHFEVIPVGEKQSLMSLWAQFGELDWPLPSFLKTFTLEVIAEKVAQKMRTFIESEKPKVQREKENGKK